MTVPNIDQMLFQEDKTRPTTTVIPYPPAFPGDKLDKLKANYATWSVAVDYHLTMSPLWEYVLGNPIPPLELSQPVAWKNFHTNIRIAHGYLANAVEPTEHEFIPRAIGPKAAWEKLKERHEKEGPIKQVLLLHEALSTSFTDDTPMPTTAANITSLIDRAYTIGDVNKDMLICIAILTALKVYLNLQSIISDKISNSTISNPYMSVDLRRFLEGQHTLSQSNKTTPGSSSSVALVAQTNKPQRERPTCDNCKCLGHTAKFCARKGGPYEKLGIQASIDARRAEEGRGKPAGTSSPGAATPGKIAVNVRGQDGHIFIMMVDPSNLSSPPPNTKPEFVGLVSSEIPMESHDEFEYGWLATGGGRTTSITRLDEILQTSRDQRSHCSLPTRSITLLKNFDRKKPILHRHWRHSSHFARTNGFPHLTTYPPPQY